MASSACFIILITMSTLQSILVNTRSDIWYDNRWRPCLENEWYRSEMPRMSATIELWKNTSPYFTNHGRELHFKCFFVVWLFYAGHWYLPLITRNMIPSDRCSNWLSKQWKVVFSVGEGNSLCTSSKLSALMFVFFLMEQNAPAT